MAAACGGDNRPEPTRTYRIGWLPGTQSERIATFQKRLERLGYVRGKNLQIDGRDSRTTVSVTVKDGVGTVESCGCVSGGAFYSPAALGPFRDGDVIRVGRGGAVEAVAPEDLLTAARAIVSDVDLLVANFSPAIAAARVVTKSAEGASGRRVPVAFISEYDPVQARFVESYAQPGGNLTGVTITGNDADLAGKQIELLKDALRDLSKIGVLYDGRQSTLWPVVESISRRLSVQAMKLEVFASADIGPALAAAANERINALLVYVDDVPGNYLNPILSLASGLRFPTMIFAINELVARSLVERVPALLYYGPSHVAAYDRLAGHVDKILRGENPADLPVERPSGWDLILNLKTARELGLTIAPSVLQQATELIQ